MRYTEAMRAVSVPEHGGARIRRAAWPPGDFLRRTTAEEHNLSHAYARDKKDKKPTAANLSAEDVLADDWAVEGVEPEKAPPAPESKSRVSDDDDDKKKSAFPSRK